ncbi:MAG: hypothetical protein C4293_02180 [Nitrospiraceae bacterium]
MHALNRLSGELAQCQSVGILTQLVDYISLAGDRADDGHFVASARDMAFLVPMAVFILSADVGFVYFHLTHQFRKR